MPELTRWVTSETIDVDRLEGAFELFRAHAGKLTAPKHRWLRAHRPNERWEFEEVDEFIAELRRGAARAEVREEHDHCVFRIEPRTSGASVTVRLPNTRAIDDVMEALGVKTRGEPNETQGLTVFLGHGRSLQWLALAEHLRGRHGLTVATYETTAAVGQPAMAVLAQLAEQASFAILLHTAEVAGEGDAYHAGANVIHETGYFQAKLGSSRALILREENCRPHTNIAGLTELRFRTGAVQEVFGDVVAILRRVSLVG